MIAVEDLPTGVQYALVSMVGALSLFLMRVCWKLAMIVHRAVSALAKLEQRLEAIEKANERTHAEVNRERDRAVIAVKNAIDSARAAIAGLITKATKQILRAVHRLGRREEETSRARPPPPAAAVGGNVVRTGAERRDGT